ncbi:PulJ/GspJ family protein [Peribacillus glennii]|nr:prepilin-type N-terminal cleavage/methylation domain-containing protein [Peribacillus glennii]
MKLNDKGLTLVEVLVSISIFFVLSSLVYGIFFSSVNSSKKVVDHNELRNELVMVAEQINDFCDNAQEFKIDEVVNGEVTAIQVVDVHDKGQSTPLKIIKKEDGDLFLIESNIERMINSDYATAEKTSLTVNNDGNLEFNFVISFKDSTRQAKAQSLFTIYDVEEGGNEPTQ